MIKILIIINASIEGNNVEPRICPDKSAKRGKIDKLKLINGIIEATNKLFL